MNIYGKAMSNSKRKAHSKVVAMVLRKAKPQSETQSMARMLLLRVNGSLSDAWYGPQLVEKIGCGGRI
jgi:hypothetical protein